MAADAQAGNPAWYEGVVTAKEMRTYDIVMLEVRLAQPMTWDPGQSVAVQSEGGPNIWRPLTPANAPRASRVMDFHVRVVPGGMMSVPLALHAGIGSRLKVAPAPSTLRLAEPPERGIVMIAGSTGLTPMLAMLDRLACYPDPPDVRLYFGAKEPDGLYELDRLDKMANELDWLTVTHAVDAPPQETDGYAGEHGSIVDVAAAGGPWQDRDAYVCGPARMVEAAAGRLLALGLPGAQLHIENFG
jgi:NAD(P)H-flavin reductase